MSGGTTVDAFQHKGVIYDHVLFSRSDDRIELQDEEGECLLTYTRDGYVLTPDGKQYGTIHNWHGHWFIKKSVSGEKVEYPHYGDDLIKAEVEISKMFLDEIKAVV